MKRIVTLLSLLIVAMLLVLEPLQVNAAHIKIPDGNARMDNGYSPYEVQNNSWRNRWRNKGGKDYEMTSGRRLVYDIYSGSSSSSIKKEWQITNSSRWGKRQPYLNFWGWSAIMGHHHHSRDNQATYILAVNTETGEEKMYKVEQSGLNATKDIEYNKRSNNNNIIYNECGRTVKNKRNTDCNMRYEWVGFKAWLPLEDLFPEGTRKASWRLYIVKNVENHVVYDELILPFHLKKLSFRDGKISLSSGLNANKLIMNGYPVIKRNSPRSNESGHTSGYFVQGKAYQRVAQDESAGTAIWYGVRDGRSTRWASSAYWVFGGDQAVLTYEMDKKKCPDGSEVYIDEDCQVNVTIYHKDVNTDELLEKESFKSTVGERYSYTPKEKGYFKDDQGRPYEPVSDPVSGRTPNNNMTFTFYYNNLKECPDGTFVGLDEDCTLDIEITHIDAKTGETLLIENIKEYVDREYTFVPKERGYFTDSDGNPYVASPADQKFSGRTDENLKITFTYRVSLPDPSNEQEIEDGTEGRAKGDFSWELTKPNALGESEIKIRNNPVIDGTHYETRNTQYVVTIDGEVDKTSNKPISYNIEEVEFTKGKEIGFEFSYEYTNHFLEVYECTFPQGEDCFEWEFSEYKPVWEKVEQAVFQESLPANHQYGEMFTFTEESDPEIELEIGRKATIDGAPASIDIEVFNEKLEVDVENAALSTQTWKPINDTVSYESDLGNPIYVLPEELYYFVHDIDDNLKEKYQNETEYDFTDYVIPLEVGFKSNKAITFKSADRFYLTKKEGFLFSVPSNVSGMTELNKKAKEQYEEWTGNTYTDTLLSNSSDGSRYYLNIDGNSEQEPNTWYADDVILGKLGLNDVKLHLDRELQFKQYLFGNALDNPLINEQQESVIDEIDYDHSIKMTPEQIREVKELAEQRTKLLHSFRSTDVIEKYDELRNILPSLH